MPKQAHGTTAVVLGKQTEWRRSFQRRHLLPTACHFHGTEAEVCVNAPSCLRSRSVLHDKKDPLLIKLEYMVLLLIWPLSSQSSPAEVLYWPSTLLLCREDTCRVLTASWQTRFLNSWLDGSPPNKPNRSAHMLHRGVKDACVFMTVYLPTVWLCHWTHSDMCVQPCAFFVYRVHIDWWELNLCSPGKLR